VTSGLTLAVLQPGYLPWLGYFDQMARADVFVHYDDVQYDKHSWRNRNRIKSATGEPAWLTVPVRHSGLDRPRLNEVLIDARSPWPRKHLGTLRQFYGRVPGFEERIAPIARILEAGHDRLVDLDLDLVEHFRGALGITTPAHRSSRLGIPGEKSERLLALCRHFGATRYLSGAAARDYLDVAAFEAKGVSVVWQDYRHPVYRQPHGAFVPFLSAVDLLLNEGAAAGSVIRGAIALQETPTS
jgi:hypothetical protein